MSARSPFRSHLLQQWARSSRPPVAVVPWLKPAAQPQHPEEEEDARRNRRPSRRHHHSSSSSSSRAHPPSLSSVDSASFASSSWKQNVPREHHPSSPSATTTTRSSTSTTRLFASAAATPLPLSSEEDEPLYGKEQIVEYQSSDDDDDGDSFPYSMSSSSSALQLQSVLQTRRTAMRLTHSTTLDDDTNNRASERAFLVQALNRAVQCAQMAPNHKRTEPFSFRRFVADTSTAQQLADISYQVTLAKTKSAPNAEAKRKKWLDIPAFLVTLVHENQTICPSMIDIEGGTSTTTTTTSPYQASPYTPPETEKQLEDYAAACAAVQNVLLSLHAEGIGSKWATGPVVRTPAFRQLVQAAPTDRVAALIMVGGMESTHFCSDRERDRTTARRHRRRSIDGDLLVDLP